MGFKRGDQIYYNPKNGTPPYHGFVTDVKGDKVFCRFWSPHHLGTLRTLGSSAVINSVDLEKMEKVPYQIIRDWLKFLGYETNEGGIN